MPTIEERWDNLPISERVEIAEAAGLEGRVGSADWGRMYEMDRETLKDWASQDGSKDDDEAKIGRGLHGRNTRVVSVLSNDIEWRGETEHKRDDTNADTGKGPEKRLEEAADTARDYLLWVGYQSYPTIRSFIDEAEGLGVCRRISRVPKNLVLEQSRVFLAHDEGESNDAVIFGYYIPTAIDIITYKDGSDGIPEYLMNIATGVTIEQAAQEAGRGRGHDHREDIGAVYLKGKLTVLEPYRDYNKIIDSKARRFRGIKKVSGDEILKGKGKRAPSEIHRIPRSERLKKKSGEKWSEEEKEILKGLLNRMRPLRAMREMSKISGRSVYAVSYQRSEIKKEARNDKR